MPSNCCVPNCVANSKTYRLLKFYRFPCEKKRGDSWKRLVRNDDLSSRPYVCSLHFTGGQKTYDINTPTIFPWSPDWEVIIEGYNEMCRTWFEMQTQSDHGYSKAPNVMRFIPMKHAKQTKKRTSKTSKCGRPGSIISNPTAMTKYETTDVDAQPTTNRVEDCDSNMETESDSEMVCNNKEEEDMDTAPTTSSQSSTTDMVHYYPETHLLLKSDLQSILNGIQEQITKKDTDITVLKQLLTTVITLLRNTTEMYDSVIELGTFQRFLLRKFTGSDEDIQFWTGFYSYSALQYFLTYLVKPNLPMLRYWGSNNSDSRQNDKCGPKRSMEPEDELFLTLVKLRQGSANEDLAERFRISESSVSRIFLTWVRFLENILTALPTWMSRKKIRKTLPDTFKGMYDDVTIIIDCTEMECERPSDFEIQAATYSDYKARNTVKALVGISPSGVPTFISDLMEGSVSDNEITMQSGLMDKLEPKSVVMADRGWTNKAAMAKHGIRLVTPAFLMDKKQLDLPSLVESVAIARVRIHVERCIGRIKQWKIITKKLHLTEWKALNSIWKVCAHLVLFWPPLL